MLRATGAEAVRVELTDFTGEWTAVVTELQERFDAVVNPDRAGAGYYEGLCFKVHPTFAGEAMETGDGGVVDWTRQLRNNGKERCVISGIGVDRIALDALREIVGADRVEEVERRLLREGRKHLAGHVGHEP